MNLVTTDERNFYNLIQVKKVIIFGASYMARDAIIYYGLKNQVECLVDNNRQKWNTYFYVNGNEALVKPPSVLKKFNNGEYILLIASKFYDEIVTQLNKMSHLDRLDCYIYPLMKEESYNMLLKNPKINCSGCYACYNICPQKCIEMKDDEEGFPFPKIDYSKCTHCGLCDDVCPIKNTLKSDTIKEDWNIFAAWSLNDDIRLSSSSGGIFSELAINVLEDRGYVCGVRYSENLTAEHCIIDNIEDLEQLRYSKYMQSDVGEIYHKMKMLLDDNKTVMFTGTPCQAAALNKFLKKKYNNLLNCSFLCGSYNSPKAFLSYLNSLEKQYGAKAKSICLRDKKNGWDDQNYSVRIIFHNGKEYYKAAGNDPFMKGFTLKSLFTRHSCYDCKYTGENRPFDISLADFWNIKNANPFLPRRKGVSLVLCHTQHGKDCFEKIRHKIYAEPHTFKDAEQLTLLRPVNYNFRRDIVMEQIDTTPFNVLIEQYLDS